MSKHTIYNGQSMTVSAGRWDGDSLSFTGTSNLSYPTVTFSGPNTLAYVADIGSAATHGYGAINVAPGGALTTHGLKVSAATLSISERPGTNVTFDGTSQVLNGSTLTATGDAGTGSYTLNGTMNIDGSSIVNMDYVQLSGSGTMHLTGENALLRAGNVGTGETVVLDGGMLSLTNGMNFLGTITDSAPSASRIGPISSVAIYNAMDAVQEIFNRSTGALNLFNAQGTEVAKLQFAGTGDLYAAPTTGLATNYMAITSHPAAGAIAVSFIG